MPSIEVPTLDDLSVQGKRVFLRSDMNVPLDRDGNIMEPRKIHEAATTVGELVEKGARVILGSHQGRPGGRDFTSTEFHSRLLSEELGIDIKHVDGVTCRWTREEIKSVGDGQVLMLENLRFCAEENIEMPPEELLRTNFVKRLIPLFDAYVNDAFHAAHRSQPSLTAFPYVLQSAAGRVMERMLFEVEEIGSIEGRRVFALAGAKMRDKFRIMEHSLRTGKADEVLTGGLVGILLSVAAGHSVGKSFGAIEDVRILLPAASEMLRDYKGKIFYPIDLVVMRNGNVETVPVYSVPTDATIVDVGPGTVELYKERMATADLTVANGPMGIFEDPRFRKGTLDFVRSARKTSKDLVLCGGHLSAAAALVEAGANRGRVYTAGGAVMFRLAELPMPAIRALREARGR